MNVDISIIIPTLNEEYEIGRTLDAAGSLAGSFEILVADGGGADHTRDIARGRGAKVISGESGRGNQLHAGAMAAKGRILWFLHADSIPTADALEQILTALSDERIVGGNFALRFDGDGLAAAFMTFFYKKIRYFGLLYGDSGIFVRQNVYREIGGFRRMPLFEDLEFVSRLRKQGKLVRIKAPIVTSSRRFDGRAFAPVFIRWVLYQCLYWLGVSPARLARSYYPVRQRPEREA